MFKVQKRDESLAKRIVNNKSDMSYAGVLAGNNPGEVWVDNLENPKAAIVFYQGQSGFQFMGEFTEAILRDNLENFINKTAKEFLKGKLNYFDFATDDQKWLEIIKRILGDTKIEESTQFVYRAGNTIRNEIETFDNVREIDSEFISLITSGAVNNPEFLLDYIKVWWGTIDNYLNKGYGFALVEDGKVVSFAISSSCYGNIQAIGVETLNEYRRRGLASYLTSLLLKVFNQNGIHVWWDCWEKNIASQKTAEKNNLKLDHKYKVCTIKYGD